MDQITTTLQGEVGKKLTIDLEAIPGAGYMWVAAQVPQELEIVSQKIISISKAIGGNSVQRFAVIPCQAGSYSMVFELKRRWEKEAVKTHIYSIQIS